MTPPGRNTHRDHTTEYAIAAALYTERFRQGVTQRQVAEKSGIDKSHIARLETGTIAGQWATLERYAAGLGMKLEWKLTPIEGDGAGV